MKKRKAYEVSVINKTYSKTYSDETKFYTSDTALELAFELKETEYNFESAEIVLLNVDDRSLATRPVSKVNNDFVYEIDDDITTHYGDWRGQLMLVENGEVHVSSPIKFRIENDLYNNKPLEITEVVSWVSLKRYANSLIDELKQAVLGVEGIEDTFNENETTRQNTFETNESERDKTFNDNETVRQTQELEREGAESQRQTVFEENESVRTETFNANETTRQENEDARIEAEKQREGTVSKIENRQDTVESKFDLLQQEIADKDVISAPEIIAARGGEETLSDRLDKEQQEVTARLAQKAPKDETQLALIALDAKIDGKTPPDPIIVENLWNTDELVSGLLSVTSGNLNPSSTMKTTPFKDIIPNQNYSFSSTPTRVVINFRFIFYDKNNNFISGEIGALSNSDGWHKIIKTPPNAVKGRISGAASTKDIFVANIGDEPMGEAAGDIWDGGFWDGIPTPPLRDGSVRENHLSAELRGKIASGGGSGDGGTGGDLGDLGEQYIYDNSSAYSSAQEKIIADVGNKSVVDLIEFSSNGILSELQIFYKENDGTEFLYDLVSNNGSSPVANTFENMQSHGSAIVDFIEFDDRNNTYKVAVKNLKFANGFKISVKNNDVASKSISTRVVSRQYV